MVVQRSLESAPIVTEIRPSNFSYEAPSLMAVRIARNYIPKEPTPRQQKELNHWLRSASSAEDQQRVAVHIREKFGRSLADMSPADSCDEVRASKYSDEISAYILPSIRVALSQIQTNSEVKTTISDAGKVLRKLWISGLIDSTPLPLLMKIVHDVNQPRVGDDTYKRDEKFASSLSNGISMRTVDSEGGFHRGVIDLGKKGEQKVSLWFEDVSDEDRKASTKGATRMWLQTQDGEILHKIPAGRSYSNLLRQIVTQYSMTQIAHMSFEGVVNALVSEIQRIDRNFLLVPRSVAEIDKLVARMGREDVVSAAWRYVIPRDTSVLRKEIKTTNASLTMTMAEHARKLTFHAPRAGQGEVTDIHYSENDGGKTLSVEFASTGSQENRFVAVYDATGKCTSTTRPSGGAQNFSGKLEALGVNILQGEILFQQAVIASMQLLPVS